MRVLNRHERVDNVFDALRDFIIKISQAKFGWLDSDSGREVLISLEDVLSPRLLTVEFRSKVDISKLEFFAVIGGERKKLSDIKVKDDSKVIELCVGSLEGITHFAMIHTSGLWAAWQYYNYVIYADITLPNAESDCRVLFDSMLMLEKIREVALLMFDYSEGKEKCDYLMKLIDSAMFTHDWVKPDSNRLDLFMDVESAIKPYSVGAHGYTLPLSSQGKDRIMSKLPDVIQTMNSLRNPWFCTSGTLLGFVRNAQLISYDDDLDFVVYLGQVEDSKHLDEVVVNFIEKNKSLLQTGINKFHYRLTGFPMAIDVFLAWSLNTESLWVYPWCAGELSCSDCFPIKEIEVGTCSAPIPNNPEQALVLNYGPGWHVPDPLWRFDWDRSNKLFSTFLNG